MTSALLLAAGLGTRLRPLTLTTPKPLIPVKGKALLDYGLDNLAKAGVTKIVVNIHYLAEHIEAHVKKHGLDIAVSDERAELLDSGGGVVKALPLLSEEFFVLNADTFWLDSGDNSLLALKKLHFERNADFTMLLAKHEQSIGFTGNGDFHLGEGGHLTRRVAGQSAPFIYAGAFLTSKAVFRDEKAVPFSLNRLWDKAILAKKLVGLPLNGRWVHVGDAASLQEAEAKL